MVIYFITSNNGKYLEAKQIVEDLVQLDIDLSEIQDIEPRNIIEAKLSEAIKLKDDNLIVEDTSLHLNCLNGFPGPLIKWMLRSVGDEGVYNLCKKYDSYSATARTIIGYKIKGDKILFFEDSIDGKIVQPKGDSGFGWDRIFIPDGFSKTFAEMTREEKNQISMRKIAFGKLNDFLKNNY